MIPFRYLPSLIGAFALFAVSGATTAHGSVYDPPAGYYASAQGLRGAELKAALHQIIRNHRSYPYTSSSKDTWDILKDADQDPSNTNNVLLIYNGASVNGAQEFNNGAGWNREHVWPQNLGGFTTATGVGTDAHNLRACNEQVNSKRGNLEFDDGGSPLTIQGLTDTYFDGDSFQANSSFKGDLARIILYMAVRYEGGGTEPDLEIDDLTNGAANNSSSIRTFGKMSTLLAWHLSDPVDDFERRRNARIFFYQGNRNPFIDNPEFARAVFDPNYQPVRFTISPSLADAVSGPVGGPFAPELQSFTVTNTSSGPISLSIETDVPWLSPNMGTLSVTASGSVSVDVLVDSGSAPSAIGTYVGRVRITDAAAGYSADYEVSLTVTEGAEWHYWDYYVDEFGNAVIFAYYGQGGAVQIPAEIDGFPVTEVGDGEESLFFYNDLYTRSPVTSVTIPSGVENIAGYAFAYSYELTTINISDSVENIFLSAFDWCLRLQEINVAPGHPFLASNSGVLFDKEQTALYIYPSGRVGSYTIPDGVLYVWEEAFADCVGLNDVSIPATVEFIGSAAFANCYGLNQVFIPAGVKSVSPFAFYNCGSLASITVEASSAHYSSLDGVLFDSSKNTLVAYPAGRFGPYAIPVGVTKIEIGAFTGCYGLTGILIPEGLTTISQYAFADCSGLSSVSIPDSVTNIDSAAFLSCEQLTDVLLMGDPPEDGTWVSNLGFSAKLHHLPRANSWQPFYGDRATQVFKPTSAPSAFIANAFQFNWSNTGSIPMNVWRATSLNGPWTLVSSNNPSSSFTDYSTPAGNAFYRAALP